MIKFVKKRIKEITILILVIMLVLASSVSGAVANLGGGNKAIYDIARTKNGRN